MILSYVATANQFYDLNLAIQLPEKKNTLKVLLLLLLLLLLSCLIESHQRLFLSVWGNLTLGHASKDRLSLDMTKSSRLVAADKSASNFPITIYRTRATVAAATHCICYSGRETETTHRQFQCQCWAQVVVVVVASAMVQEQNVAAAAAVLGNK